MDGIADHTGRCAARPARQLFDVPDARYFRRRLGVWESAEAAAVFAALLALLLDMVLLAAVAAFLPVCRVFTI